MDIETNNNMFAENMFKRIQEKKEMINNKRQQLEEKKKLDQQQKFEEKYTHLLESWIKHVDNKYKKEYDNLNDEENEENEEDEEDENEDDENEDEENEEENEEFHEDDFYIDNDKYEIDFLDQFCKERSNRYKLKYHVYTSNGSKSFFSFFIEEVKEELMMN